MSWYPPVPDHVTDEDGHAWRVRRAWPGMQAGDYVLEVDRPGIGSVRAAHLRDGRIHLVPPDDPGLPALALEAARGSVVVHRAHKRAVIDAGDRYIKVFRPGRASEAAQRHTCVRNILASASLRFPRVLEHTADTIVFSTLPGRSFFELGQQPGLTDAEYARIWHQWSRSWIRALRSPFALSPDDQAHFPVHPPEAEAQNLRRWLNHWMRHSAQVPEAARARAILAARAETAINLLLSTPPGPFAWSHGDLHDKQIFGGAHQATGLLDLDGSCRAEAALDLANLDVHIALRFHQKLLSAHRFHIAHKEISRAASELGIPPDRFDAYAETTRLRLTCLYSFRPPWNARAVRYISWTTACADSVHPSLQGADHETR